MPNQTTDSKTRKFEILTEGKNAFLRFVEYDAPFTYLQPVAKGTIDEMRQKAQELLERNSHIEGLTIQEIDLLALQKTIEAHHSPRVEG